MPNETIKVTRSFKRNKSLSAERVRTDSWQGRRTSALEHKEDMGEATSGDALLRTDSGYDTATG